MQDNLSKSERLALNGLEEDKSIIIWNSEKGGMIVIMNVESYLVESVKQMSDSHTYMRLKENPTRKQINFFGISR